MIAGVELSVQEAFYITGIAVRTTNQNGQSQRDIGDVWTRFISEDLKQNIDNRLSDDIYCVYTNYETDHTGFYTAVLGCKVSSPKPIREDFTAIILPGGKYEVYSLAGKFPDNVSEAWQRIWNGDSNRVYTADYDLYSANPKTFEDTKVKIYLAVK